MAGKRSRAVLLACLESGAAENLHQASPERREIDVFYHNLVLVMKDCGGRVIDRGEHAVAAMFETTAEALDCALELRRGVQEGGSAPAPYRFIIELEDHPEDARRRDYLNASYAGLPEIGREGDIWLSRKAYEEARETPDVEFLPLENTRSDNAFYQARSRLGGLRRPKIMGMGEGSGIRSRAALWLGMGLLVLAVAVAIRDCYFPR